jgi:hypothetical protein
MVITQFCSNLYLFRERFCVNKKIDKTKVIYLKMFYPNNFKPLKMMPNFKKMIYAEMVKEKKLI